MKWVTTEHQEILGNWALERIAWAGRFTAGHSTWGPFTAIGLIDEKEILATVIYNDFYEVGCAIHIAAVPGRRWMTRELLRAAFSYPFVQLGFKRLTGYVPAKNWEAQRLDEHLGFRREGLLRQMLPDDDVICYGMLANECRFINHGQTSSTFGSRSVSNCGRTDRRESAERSVSRGAESHEYLRSDRIADLQE